MKMITPVFSIPVRVEMNKTKNSGYVSHDGNATFTFMLPLDWSFAKNTF